ncbi:trna -lysidine synthetase [Leptolyngbya sp. Heron Island J]|uniref:tRNA lysidine(34) synthetase TilS n=1 Tax=Leptolyngbya sp. Heron Island J TaxID=1385935 RepID=UPI0003B9C6D8|nr:tRNA lysidine(34) synthetase TilS [Leptolyngbya sp. Heron Island J]ESA37623.1 trna -lysidine synthetase [Leptolyngbya sp. Heron Island J]
MPWTPIHARIHTLLKATRLLPQEAAILVAVSGGQDSLCLAQLLLDLGPKWGWRLAIVHCDHGWRADSADNATHVVQLAQQWQLPCFVETAQALPATEAAARSWRYGVFAALAHHHGYDYVATGHTATDRAETVLYNLLRGSGADGIQALSWQRSLSIEHSNIYVTRPLLQLTRQATAAFCRDLGLPVWHDTSNNDWTYRRNRIRHELMPYLRSHFNPKVETTLAQTAEIFTAEVIYLEQQTDQLYHQVIDEYQDSWRIHRSRFQSAPLALQRRVARRLLQTVLPQQPSFDHIEKLVVLADRPNRTQTDPFPGGRIARVEHDWIHLQ